MCIQKRSTYCCWWWQPPLLILEVVYCTVHLHKAHFWYLRTVGRVEMAELLRQEMPGATWDSGREGGAGHTLTGTAWLTPSSRLGLPTWVWRRAHKQLSNNRPPLV